MYIGANMWEIKIILDADRTDCGTITGTWVKGEDIFVFSRRSLIDEKDKANFMTQAIKARDAWQARNVNEKEAGLAITNKINADDPQVGV